MHGRGWTAIALNRVTDTEQWMSPGLRFALGLQMGSQAMRSNLMPCFGGCRVRFDSCCGVLIGKSQLRSDSVDVPGLIGS